MADVQAKVKPKSAEVLVRVRRADGTVEDLGVVAGYYRNPLKRLVNRIRGKGRVSLGSKEE